MDAHRDGQVNEIRSLDALMEELNQALKDLEATVLQPREAANEALRISKEHEMNARDMRSKKQRMEVQLARIEERTDIRQKEGQVQAMQEQIEKTAASIGTLSTEIAELRSEAIIWRYWEQGFKVIRFKVLEATVELLQRTLTSIAVGALGLDADEVKVSMFKDGTKTKRAEVTITVRRGEHEIPLGMLSDGESQRMDLACFIALGALVKQITGMDLGFRVFDEPLTNLDADGKYKAFHLIKEIPEAQKFVIDHDAHFQDMFDKSVTVIKKGDRSCISA
jgi:DNA repair exonuclease SbcCD ATPase subunit